VPSPTPTKTFDADTVSLAVLADVVGEMMTTWLARGDYGS